MKFDYPDQKMCPNYPKSKMNGDVPMKFDHVSAMFDKNDDILFGVI